MEAVIDALDAHAVMSIQALGSEDVRKGLQDVLLNDAAVREPAGAGGLGLTGEPQRRSRRRWRHGQFFPAGACDVRAEARESDSAHKEARQSLRLPGLLLFLVGTAGFEPATP